MVLFRRPAACEGQDLTMFDIPASGMSNAKDGQHNGSYGGSESCLSKFLFHLIANLYNCILQSFHATEDIINSYVDHIWQNLVPIQAYKKTKVDQQTRYAFFPVEQEV